MAGVNQKIEAFLRNKPNTVYSLNTIARNIETKKRTVYHHIIKNKNIITCDSYDVGSSKDCLKLYKIV